ncbi:BnaC08g42800D [Brassica napus]|uniref:BnaC08g42800D protein n=1 Tax=Brassica napus TaxID=3708 RepID=A0A078GBB0_BRANA|nr:BnaC08g42800D [Brassica napus]
MGQAQRTKPKHNTK